MHHSHRHHKKSEKILKRLIPIIVLLISLSILFFLSGKIRESQRTKIPEDYKESYKPVEKERKKIEKDGKVYTEKSDIETYLVMGIDVDGKVEDNQNISISDLGQADVQAVIVVDNKNESWQILELNRDTMADVKQISSFGQSLGYKKMQLALAHSYGTNLKEGCENTVDAVSRLLYDQAFDGYISMNMDSVKIITDMVGGVDLEITSDFSKIDTSLLEGQTQTITGEQALTFIRARMGIDDGTNQSRMNRQNQFLSALMSKISEEDDKFIAEAYNESSDYIVSDMGSGPVINLGEKLHKYEYKGLLTIEGESSVNDETGYVEYVLDENDLKEKIIQIFYAMQ